jgi:riboflavin biosynthesis pyrimidine reductase
LVHSLREHDLVDELRVMIFPVVLGSGRRAFPDDLADKRAFELFDHRQYGSIVVHAYRRAGR